MGKDLQELTEAMHDFVSAKGWYADQSKRPQTPRNIAVSLVLEASEVLEHFQWHSETDQQESLASELADVMLYLLQLAQLYNINLEEAIENKLKTNYGREWDQSTVK